MDLEQSDRHAWVLEMARALRRGDFSQIDAKGVAEELERIIDGKIHGLEPMAPNEEQPPDFLKLIYAGTRYDYDYDGQRDIEAEKIVDADAWVSFEHEKQKSVEVHISFESIRLDPAPQNGFHLQMSPKTARSLAYALLWYANKIQSER